MSGSIVRSVATGMVIGSALSICNIYSGLKVGWSSNMSVTGALLAYAVWAVRPRRWAQATPFGIDETNYAQTAASAAAAVSSAGLVAGIPALALMTGVVLPWHKLALWVFGVCILGIMIAVVLRKPLLVHDPLPFPIGMATAETLRQMYAKGREALARVGALGVAAVVSGTVKTLEFFKFLPSAVALPGTVKGYTLKNLTFAVEPGLLLFGIGGLMGTRACISILFGAVVAYGVGGTMLLSAGYVAPGKPDALWFKPLVEWLLWPGVSMMVFASLTHLLLSGRTLVRGLLGVGAVAKGDGSASPEAAATDERSDDVPIAWMKIALPIGIVFIAFLQVWFFGIPIWAALVAIALSAVLAVVAARVAGETGVTPIGAMGKVTQLTIGAAIPGDATANLMTANVTGGAASQCADLMNDLKTGVVLGASPRKQWIAQLFGAVGGALVGSFVYLTLITDPASQLMTQQWPAPAVITWKTVAEVFQKGVSAMPPGTPAAVVAAAVAGVLLAILESKGPQRLRPWVPSPSAVGLTFVVPAYQSISLFLGGVVALILAKVAPRWHERFWIVVCAGFIAGEGLTGAGLSLYQILK